MGVWNFKGRNEFGGVTLLTDFDEGALNDRIVNFVFDSDVVTKLQVGDALGRLIEQLQRRGAAVNAVFLPSGPTGDKLGVDDLKALVKEHPAAPRQHPPRWNWWTKPRLLWSRPIALISGHAYSATCLWARVT